MHLVYGCNKNATTEAKRIFYILIYFMHLITAANIEHVRLF